MERVLTRLDPEGLFTGAGALKAEGLNRVAQEYERRLSPISLEGLGRIFFNLRL